MCLSTQQILRALESEGDLVVVCRKMHFFPIFPDPVSITFPLDMGRPLPP